MRRLCALVFLLLMPLGLAAQEFSGLARLDPAASGFEDDWRGRMDVTLDLSQPVPWRVFTLDRPKRLVIDFREVDFAGADPDALDRADGIRALRFGSFRPGWSRLVADLDRPLLVETAVMEVDPSSGAATVRLRLVPTDAEGFAAAAGAPPDPGWEALAEADPVTPAPAPDDARPLVVAIDPGHGGIDTGTIQGGVEEADLMLIMAAELAEALRRAGMQPVLTRTDDSFVSLAERMTRARAAGADVFISLHADALEGDQASGASVYTLSAEARDDASDRIVERHGRGDLLAGLDLAGEGDQIATVLMDLARLETAPAADRLQQALVGAMAETGTVMNTRPARSARLAVLNAADMSSVLVEVGFLSNPEDRARLTTREGRAPLIAGLVLGLDRWADGEAALDPLRRR